MKTTKPQESSTTLYDSYGVVNMKELSSRLVYWSNELDNALTVREVERPASAIRMLVSILNTNLDRKA